MTIGEVVDILSTQIQLRDLASEYLQNQQGIKAKTNMLTTREKDFLAGWLVVSLQERCSEMRHISSTHVSTKQNCYSKNTLETKLYFLSKDRTQKNLENLSILCFVVYSENNREFACRYSRFLLEFRGVEKGVRI